MDCEGCEWHTIRGLGARWLNRARLRRVAAEVHGGLAGGEGRCGAGPRDASELALALMRRGCVPTLAVGLRQVVACKRSMILC